MTPPGPPPPTGLGTRLALVAALGALARPVPGLAPSAESCGACGDRGLVACERHARSELDDELHALYCGELAGCEACGGAGWLDCERCTAQEPERWLAARRATRTEREEALAWIAEGMERAVRVVESDHFVLVWELEGLKIDRKRLDPHRAMHVYAGRLERVFAEYVDALGADPEGFAGKAHLFVWGEQDDQLRAAAELCDTEGDAAEYGAFRYGFEGRASVCGAKQYYKSDEELHAALAHYAVHVLAGLQVPSAWLGGIGAGWADVGLAHWFEERLFGACESICHGASYQRSRVRSNRWRAHLKKAVDDDDFPSAEVVMVQNSDTMPIDFHVAAFGYVDYLVARDPDRFGMLLGRLRRRTPARDALFEVYGLTLDDFDAAWRDWVRATY